MGSRLFLTEARANTEKPPSRKTLARFCPYVALSVYVGTLFVYPTVLNPGVPLMLAGVLLVLLGLARLFWGSGKYYNPTQEISVFLLLWLALSLSVKGVDHYLGEKSLYTFAGAVAFLVSVQLGLQRGRQARTLVYVFVGLMGLVCLQAWVEAIPAALGTGEFVYLQGRFVNPDTFSIQPMIGLLVGCGLLERIPRKMLLPYCGLLSFLLVSILATGCRAAALGLVVGGLVFVGTVSAFQKKELDQTKYLATLPLLLILILLPLSAFNFAAVEKFAGSFDGDTIFHERTRVEVNTHGWRAVAKNPVFGGGPGSFGLIYQGVRPPGHDTLYVNIAHNDFVEMAVEAGVVGLGLWLVLLGGALLKLFRCAKKGRRGFLASGILGALCATLVFSLFNFVLPERPVLWLLLFLVGMGLSFPSTRVRSKERPVFRVFGGLVLACLGVLSFLFGRECWLADSYVLQAHSKSEALLKEAAVEDLERALELQPERAALSLFLSRECRALATLTGDAAWSKRQETALLNAASASPYNVHPLVELSEYYQRLESFEKAEKYLIEAKARDPHRPSFVAKTSSFLIRRGELKSAAEYLLTVVDSGQHSSYRQLRGLFLTLGRTKPGELAAILDGVAQGEKWFEDMCAELVEQLAGEEKWKSVSVLADFLLESGPDDLCAALWRARAEGQIVGREGEFHRLSGIVDDAEDLRRPCAKDVMNLYVDHLKDIEGPDACKKYLEKQVELFPRSPDYGLYLSEMYEEDGAYREAQRVLRDVVKNGRASAKVNYRLALLYEKTDSIQLATSYYREALKLEPGHIEASRRLKALLK